MCIWVIVQLRELWLLIEHILLYVTERKPEVQVIYMKYAVFTPSFLHPQEVPACSITFLHTGAATVSSSLVLTLISVCSLFCLSLLR